MMRKLKKGFHMTYRIDNTVPLPERRAGPEFKYPYLRMQPGESVFVAHHYVNVSAWNKRSGFKFTSKQVCEHGVDGRRVWRIA